MLHTGVVLVQCSEFILVLVLLLYTQSNGRGLK